MWHDTSPVSQEDKSFCMVLVCILSENAHHNVECIDSMIFSGFTSLQEQNSNSKAFSKDLHGIIILNI